MSTRYVRNTCVFMLLGGLLSAGNAQAETTTCTNITSVPMVITAQGVYCLKQDVTTASSNDIAVWIQANNVTLDCNDHKIGGLGAGPATESTGIYAFDQSTITIRHCNIRGFRRGITIYGDGGPNNGSGHLVEDNLLERNTEQGIYVIGNGSVVQRNRVIDTGGKPGSTRANAISVLGDAIDNVVDGVHGADDVVNFLPEGIYSGGVGNTPGIGFVVKGNRVRNLVPKGASEARGITNAGYGIVVRENTIAQYSATTGKGVYCSLSAVLYGNTITSYSQPMFGGCYDAGGNVTF